MSFDLISDSGSFGMNNYTYRTLVYEYVKKVCGTTDSNGLYYALNDGAKVSAEQSVEIANNLPTDGDYEGWGLADWMRASGGFEVC